MSRPLAPEALVHGPPSPFDPAVSPDGRRVLYGLSQTVTVKEKKKRAGQLWLCDVDGANPRQLTSGGEWSRNGRWSLDGRRIAFLSDRVKPLGLFVIDADGPGEARELFKGPRDVGGLTWSPDGERIAYARDVDPDNPEGKEPEEGAPAPVRVARRLDYKYDLRGFLGAKRRQLFVVEVASGERRQLTTGERDHTSPGWSPDGRVVACLVGEGTWLSKLALVDAASGETTVVEPPDGGVASFSWSPKGDRLFVVGAPERATHPELFVYDVASGQLRQLTDDLACLPITGAPGQPPAAPVWLDDHRVLFGGARAAASGLYTVDVEGGEVVLVSSIRASRLGLSVDDARRFVVQAHYGPDALAELSVFDLAAGTDRVITSYSAPFFDESPGPDWERFEAPRAGFSIEAWLLKPPDFDPTRRYPLVLDVHGGPHGYYGYSFSAVQRLLASSGFLVLYANPRGSASYGRAFSMAVLRDWGGEDYLDLMAVVDATLERPYVDPDRTAIYGYSYGGFMTAWSIGHTDRFKAAVCGAPVYDLTSAFGTSDIGFAWMEAEFGGPPHEHAAFYADRSPSTHAHRARTPTLILQGEADLRCPLGQSEQLFVTLMKAGCPAELIRYPGGNHLFPWNGPPEHRIDFLTRVRDWLCRYLEVEVPERATETAAAPG